MKKNIIISVALLAFVSFYDISALECLKGISYKLPHKSENPSSIAFSPEGNQIALGIRDNYLDKENYGIAVLSITDGVVHDGTTYHMSGVGYPTSVAFSPDGNYFVSANLGWETSRFAFYPSITIFAVTNGGLHSSRNHNLPLTMPTTPYSPSSVTFSPNGNQVVTANAGNSFFCQTNSITVLSVSGTNVYHASNYFVSPSSRCPCWASFSPDGKYLATANTDTVTIFEVGSNYKSTAYKLPQGSSVLSSVAFSPDGKYLATTNNIPNSVTLFLVADGVLSTGMTYPLPPNSKNPHSAKFSPDGKYLVTANYDSGDITLFTVTDGGLRNGVSCALPADSHKPKALAFSPDGKYLVTANYESHDITVFGLD